MDVDRESHRNHLETGFAGMGDLKRTWAQILCYALATRAAVALLFLPGLALLLRLFLSWQGKEALSDQEIVVFVLSPLGIVALFAVGAVSLAVIGLDQAVLMAIGLGAARRTRRTTRNS